MSNFYRQLHSMGTRLEIVIPGLDEKVGLELTRGIQDELQKLVFQISNYDPNSGISLVNRNAYREAVEVDEYLRQLIENGLEAYKKTNSFFDFTLGAWTSKPDLISDTGGRFAALTVVPMEERIMLNGNSVQLLHKDVRLDSGGLGKGQALQIIEKLLKGMGILSAFISFGGSSILAIGKHPFGDSWKVGIQNPLKESETIEEIELLDNTLSISGNSFNNRNKYGEQGHILNPHTGEFLKEIELLCAMSPNPVEAEIVSTAIAAAGIEKEEEIFANFENLHVKRIQT